MLQQGMNLLAERRPGQELGTLADVGSADADTVGREMKPQGDRRMETSGVALPVEEADNYLIAPVLVAPGLPNGPAERLHVDRAVGLRGAMLLLGTDLGDMADQQDRH